MSRAAKRWFVVVVIFVSLCLTLIYGGEKKLELAELFNRPVRDATDSIIFLTDDTKPCALRRYSTGLVCVCNETYCDELDDATVKTSDSNEIIVVSTSKVGKVHKLIVICSDNISPPRMVFGFK